MRQLDETKPSTLLPPGSLTPPDSFPHPQATLPPTFVDRFILLPEVLHITGGSKTSIYQEMAEGRFPKNFSLNEGGRRKVWLLSEVLQWQQNRIAAARSEGK